MPHSKIRLMANWKPTNSLHKPTAVTDVSLVMARHNAESGLDTLRSRASGACCSVARAMSTMTGMLRRARMIPPGPTLSPTG